MAHGSMGKRVAHHIAGGAALTGHAPRRKAGFPDLGFAPHAESECPITAHPLPADFLDRYGPRALVLGGSEGIGEAFARQLAAAGFDLTLVARRGDVLEKAAQQIRDVSDVDVACEIVDLAAPDLESRAAAIIESGDHGLVVYNAGASHGVNLFLDRPVSQALSLVRLNCLGPVVFAHHALSRMTERGRGGLILVSSMSALAGGGYIAAYSASKAFEIALAEGLHWEMQRKGVDVTCLVAGLTDTPAMAAAGMAVESDPDLPAMTSDEVAAIGLADLGKKAVTYAVGDAAAAAMRAMPREDLTDFMARSSARLWGIEIEDGDKRK